MRTCVRLSRRTYTPVPWYLNKKLFDLSKTIDEVSAVLNEEKAP